MMLEFEGILQEEDGTNKKARAVGPGLSRLLPNLARWGLFGVFIRAELLVAGIACFANGFDLDGNVGVIASFGRRG